MVAPPVPTHIEQGKLPIETIPPAPATALPMSPSAPPVLPITSEPSITIFASEFRGLIQQHLGLLSPPQPDLPTSSEPLAPTKDTIPTEGTTTTEVQVSPPQEGTTYAIASVDPQDEPQTVDTVTTTLEDTSSPLEVATT
ncbi:hypothetical protein AAG906_022549 [Vitis piasezkii]